ncbi:hypothetical protein ACFVGY_14480 [Streptomyces sp. NPDC127106]|uniref:hypothetical protein n=1 Tax=Streptomyces sp. NPDC127106 TaxID=3345360 RepID=UPI003636923E
MAAGAGAGRTAPRGQRLRLVRRRRTGRRQGTDLTALARTTTALPVIANGGLHHHHHHDAAARALDQGTQT